MPHQPVMQKMLMMPARPLNTLCHPPMRVMPSLETHVVPHALMALSKSDATAIRMLMATITNGYALNQWLLPMDPQRYLSTMKPMHPAVAA